MKPGPTRGNKAVLIDRSSVRTFGWWEKASDRREAEGMLHRGKVEFSVRSLADGELAVLFHNASKTLLPTHYAPLLLFFCSTCFIVSRARRERDTGERRGRASILILPQTRREARLRFLPPVLLLSSKDTGCLLCSEGFQCELTHSLGLHHLMRDIAGYPTGRTRDGPRGGIQALDRPNADAVLERCSENDTGGALL